jgi:hypothetical protein
MQIEVIVKGDDGKLLGEFRAFNAYPASLVTVALWEDGTPVVTDDEANTYVNIPPELERRPTQGYESDQTPMSVSPSWKSDGTGFRDEDEIVPAKE